MKLYLDDNRAGRRLASLLEKAGHTVVVPADVALTGASDPRHLRHAISADLCVLTADRVDFWELHELVLTCGGNHPGILIVRFDSDPKKNMKPGHIVTAVGKFERSGIAVANQVIVLNLWR